MDDISEDVIAIAKQNKPKNEGTEKYTIGQQPVKIEELL